MKFNYKQQPGMECSNKKYANTHPPLVSIITPYYNAGQYICQTCNCVMNQTFPWFEWIIVNDGSTNLEDVELLYELEKQDSRIHVFHKENGGISSARNFGINHAQTEFVLPLDADDLLEATYIEYCWWMLQKNPKASWAYTDSLGFQGQEYLWHKLFDPIRMKQENLLTATALIRKEVLLSIGGYAELNKHYNEDWYAWLNIISRGGYPVQSCGEYLFWYRRNDVGVLSKVKSDEKIARKNRELIASAASKIKNPAPAIIYPGFSSKNNNCPTLSSWNRCVYSKKENRNILFILSELKYEREIKFYKDLFSELNAEQCDIGIITLDRNPHEWVQEFRKEISNIFNLANFMELSDYAEFISYYMSARQVDCVAVNGSKLQYAILPWIRRNFSDVLIVDISNHMHQKYSLGKESVIEKTFWKNKDKVISIASEIKKMMNDPSFLSKRRSYSNILQDQSDDIIELLRHAIQLQRKKESRNFLRKVEECVRHIIRR